jgi:hypothetical protein
MFRRAAMLFALIVLASSVSIALPSGCQNFYCFEDGYGGEFCFQPLSGGGVGNLVGCTTVRQCNGRGECTVYCQSISCYYV